MALSKRTSLLKERPRKKMLLRARGHGNDAAFAAMALSARHGRTALDGWMGLSAAEFRKLMRRHFPGVKIPTGVRSGLQRPKVRSLEWDELRRLSLSHRAGRDVSALYLANIVCSGCLGSDHLWQDLGLFARGEHHIGRAPCRGSGWFLGACVSVALGEQRMNACKLQR